MKIAGIRFKDNWKIYDFDASDVEASVGEWVVVESDRGLGYGRVVRLREGDELPPLPQAQEQRPRQRQPVRNHEKEPEEEEVDIPTGDEPEPAPAPAEQEKTPRGRRKVLRKATEDDARKAEKNRGREAEAYRMCQDMIAEREMPMKLIRAEYSFDGSRATFYFFSENRVDFRDLVKDLAHKLRSRIEMRQVGVRDVARMIGGFGPCGRELCCTAFLRGFEPVSIRMAKKQEMVLNPAKISGVCGRLLCCLSYEFQVYDEIKKDIASMKETAVQAKRAEEEKKQEEARREAEERRQEEEKRRQEQKQRERQRREEQKEKAAPRQERKREQQPQQEQKGRPPQEQRERREQQPKPKPQPQEQQQKAEAEGQPQSEKQGEKGKRKRKFWRRKKKKPDGSTPPAAG